MSVDLKEAWAFYQALLVDFNNQENPEGKTLSPMLTPAKDAQALANKVKEAAIARKKARDLELAKAEPPVTSWTFSNS
jgi:hypothetical protein